MRRWETEKVPVVIVLDNIRSLFNVGAIFRTADAFRIRSIFLCGITATPPHREIHKTALGATESVEWKYFKEVSEALKILKQEGYKIYAIEQADKSTKINDWAIDKGDKLAIIFGNEVRGVSEEVLPLVDSCIEIPQYGTKHSLNVSVSAGIIIWKVFDTLKDKIIS